MWVTNQLHKNYVVWQKSNETDFLFAMNFILFPNQGYPLQNSSLWQLYSERGNACIVRTSVGRLQPLYPSAPQLHSSGYYPKYLNGELSSGFWAGGIKEVTGTENRQIERLRNNRNASFYQNIVNGDCSVTWGVVVGQHPSACNVWLHMCYHFLSLPRSSHKKFDWQFVLVAQIPCRRSPDCQRKTNEHQFDFGFAHSRFLGTGRVCSVPLQTLAFCLGVVLQNK